MPVRSAGQVRSRVRKAARREVPIRTASGIPGPGPVKSELGCGFRGCEGAQVQPTVCRAGARRGGARADPVVAGAEGRAGGGPWIPRHSPAAFPCSHPAQERKPSERFLESRGSRVPVQSQSSCTLPGSLRMRPRRTGGAPLRLVLALSQGKRGMCSALPSGGTCAGPRGKKGGVTVNLSAGSPRLRSDPRGPRLSAIRSQFDTDFPNLLSPAWCPH